MDMLILLLALLLGGLAGWALRAQARSVAVNRQLLRASLLALLALMGLKLGAQRALFARDLSVLLLAAASALFLVLFFALLFWAWSLLRPRPAAVREDAGGAAGGSHELWALLLNGGCILGGFLLFLALPGALYLLEPIRDLSAADAEEQLFSRIGAYVLDRDFFRATLGLTDEELASGEQLSYTPFHAQALKSVRNHEAQAALLTRAVPMELLREVSERGLTMPRKSTYFHPKLPTGLLFSLFERP